MLERLEAFRDLIRHGDKLLGEVVACCRDAETALAQATRERQEIDVVRGELDEVRHRADAEVTAARAAMAQVDGQRQELAQMRGALLQAKGDLEVYQRSQQTTTEALQERLREAKEHQQQLEQELQRAREQRAATRAIDEKLARLDQLEGKLRATETELSATRQALDEERGRRDRAIALIRPKVVPADAAAAEITQS